MFHLRTAAPLIAALTACASAPSSPQQPEPEVIRSAAFSIAPTTQKLLVLHASDTEAEVLENEGAGGVARFRAVMDALRRRAREPTIVVAAGDLMLPAPALRIEVDGKNPVQVGNNLSGFQISGIGNHEFDRGEAFLAGMISGSAFPYVSATLEIGEGPLAPLATRLKPTDPAPWAERSAGRILPRARLCAGALDASGVCRGVTVGVTGATTELLRQISGPSQQMSIAGTAQAVADAVQRQVDALRAEKIGVILLLSHLQDVRNEIALIQSAGVTGVDVIVAGGGDDRLAESSDRLLPGDERAPVCDEIGGTCYPVILTARDGAPVVVAATDGQLRYVGSLALAFDARGILTGVDATSSRPWPVDDVTVRELEAQRPPEAVAFEDRVREVLVPLTRPFAVTEVFLNGEREAVRNRETNLGSLSADAMAWAARQNRQPGLPDVAFALRNGGGVRDAIGTVDPATGAVHGGPIAPIDLQTALQFDNPLVVVTTTHRLLKETLEAALRGAGTGRGQFPQVSGEVLLEYDPSQPEQVPVVQNADVVGVGKPGQRVRTLVIRRAGKPTLTVVKDGKVLQPDAPVTFATLTFLARGGDGYFPGVVKALQVQPVLDLPTPRPITEQSSLRGYIEWLEARGEWKAGSGYPDPDPGKPATFKRIRALAQAATARDQ